MKKIAFIIFGILLVSCTSSINFIADNSDAKITIDGSYNDWQGILKPVEKEGFLAGFSYNDYKIKLCYVFSDQNKIRKVLRNGCTIYFKGEGVESFGIKYPLVDNLRNTIPSQDFDRERMDGNPENVREEFLSKIIKKFNEFTIINKDDYPINTYLVDSKSNYTLKMVYNDYKLVYEIEIDTKDLSFFNNFNKSNNLSIGIVTNQVEFPFQQRQHGGFDDGDDDNPNFGGPGMHRRPGVFRDKNFDEMQKPMEFWFNVKFN